MDLGHLAARLDLRSEHADPMRRHLVLSYLAFVESVESMK